MGNKKIKETDCQDLQKEEPVLQEEDYPAYREDGSEILHYDNPNFLVFCRRNYIPANVKLYNVLIHWHVDLEFIYVTKGRAGYQLNGKKIVMNAGEGIFMNSKQMHMIVPESVDCELDCLIFNPMILCSTPLVEEHYVQPLITNEAIPYIIFSEEIPWQKKLLKIIASIVDDSFQPERELMMVGKLNELWMTLYENTDCKQTGSKDTGHKLLCMKKMIEYIHMNYSGDIALTDICKSGDVGETTCTKLFSEYTGLTPIEYVRNIRINKSIELLCDTDMTISEIAYEVGFGGASFYTETFKKKMGITPRKFRNRERGL